MMMQMSRLQFRRLRLRLFSNVVSAAAATETDASAAVAIIVDHVGARESKVIPCIKEKL